MAVLFLSHHCLCAKQRAIAAAHQCEGVVDQALGLAPFTRGFPLGTAANMHMRINKSACDHIGSSGLAVWQVDHVQHSQEKL